MLCACVAAKSRYLQPAILNDVIMFLCHFNVPSRDPAMRVCLQLMTTQINCLALDQLTTLAHCLSQLEEPTRQTRLLHELAAVLCSGRADQLSMLCIEHKIYLLQEFGGSLPFTDELLESLWSDRRELYQWQRAGALLTALAHTARSTTADPASSTAVQWRHSGLEEWCMDVLRRQHHWLGADDVQSLLSALILLGVYDGALFRLLGDHVIDLGVDWECRLNVWTLLADADFLHIGLMSAVLADLRTSTGNGGVEQMSADTQLAVVSLLAEAASYYRATGYQDDVHADDGALIQQLTLALQTADNIPTGNCFSMHRVTVT